jgi:hypothetical protein
MLSCRSLSRVSCRRALARRDYDSAMRSMPTVLLVLSFPAGALAYALTVQALEALQLSGDGREILILFVPLFVAGLVMMPFLIPYIDRRAKEDLASITSQRAADRGTGGPDDGSSSPDRERDRASGAPPTAGDQREPTD